MKTTTKNCLNCEQEFQARLSEIRRGNGKFCSTSCSSKYAAKQRPPKEPNCECALCGKKFYKKPYSLTKSKSGLFFCCRAHKDAAQRIGGIEEIMPPHYGAGVYGDSKAYRKIAFAHYSHKCCHCGYNEHPEILQVHHKDRDHKNNDISNLEVLCPTCHTWQHYLTQSGLYNAMKKT